MGNMARELYFVEMTAARVALTVADGWQHLERAHILSQRYPVLHVRHHAAMLGCALRGGDRREALGQVLRIVVAAPGSVTGRYPEGNTGRTSAGLRTPMPIPADLAAALGENSERRKVRGGQPQPPCAPITTSYSSFAGWNNTDLDALHGWWQ